jgi:hypothetical protein
MMNVAVCGEAARITHTLVRCSMIARDFKLGHLGKLPFYQETNPMTPLLTYFDVRGRAEIVRLILEETATS